MSESDQIVIHCLACGGRLRTSRASIGSQVGCPTCQAPVTVRDPASAATPMIVDPRVKTGTNLTARGESITHSASDSTFKERFRTTAEPSLQVDPNNPTMIRRDHRRQKHADTLTDWDRQPQRASRHRHTRNIAIGLSVVALVLTLALTAIFWQRIHPSSAATARQVTPPAQTLDEQSPADIRNQVWSVAEKFATAPTAEALLPFIREPDRVAPLIKRFYTPQNPWTPLPIGLRPDLSDLQVHRNFAVFQLPLTDFGTRPIGLEQTPTGFLVDWESFVGYSELSWPDLRQTRPRTPVLLRAVIKPSDYWNLDFPSSSTHAAFQISDFHSDHVLYGYVPVDSDVLLQIKKILLSAPTIHAVIRVRYPENSTNDRQLEITEVLEKGWIFREDDHPENALKVSPLDLSRQPGSAPATPAGLSSP